MSGEPTTRGKRVRRWLPAGVAVSVVIGVAVLGRAYRTTPDDRLIGVLAVLDHEQVADIRGLLRQGADVNVRGRDGDTPLLRACLWGDVGLVRECLARGADPRAVDDEGCTGLMLAAMCRGRVGVIEELLAAGVDPNARRHNGGTALMDAACQGDSEAVSLLLRHGADPNARSDRGETPLTLARKHFRSEQGEAVARLLEAAGARP